MTFGDLMVFERKRWKHRNRGKTLLWKRLLWLAAMALSVAVSVILAFLGYFKAPSVIWFALLGILYAAPGIGAGAMAREWKEDTWYWWLSLPVAREKLLAAKLLNALSRWIRIWLTLFVFVSVYVALSDAALGQWAWSLFLGQIQFGWKEGILAIIEAPLLIAIGLWMGSLQRSKKFKVIIAPLWLVVVLIINSQLTGLTVAGSGAQLQPELVLSYQWLAVKLVAAYVMTAVIFFGLARWLEHPK